MMNKKGAIPAPVLVVGGVIVFLLLIFAIGWAIEYYADKVSPSPEQTFQEKLDERSDISELLGSSSLKFLTYVFGGIPKSLIAEIGATPAIIIILVLFIMLVVSFGDILASFSAFSETTSWILGVLLAIIAANFKVIFFPPIEIIKNKSRRKRY